MTTLLFRDTPYERVKAGLDRKMIYTGHLMSVLLDFPAGRGLRLNHYIVMFTSRFPLFVKGRFCSFVKGKLLFG